MERKMLKQMNYEGKIKISELKPHSQNSYYFDDMEGDAWDSLLQSISTSGVTNAITINSNKIKYKGKGMLLLRNKFFKSCCFNTNIQKFFKDNNITEISQLNGQTIATDIKDIKIITTPSSIKYFKFGKLEDWFNNIYPYFGVVKYDKDTHYFNGRMVQAHYQLLNTLQANHLLVLIRMENSSFLHHSHHIRLYQMEHHFLNLLYSFQ